MLMQDRCYKAVFISDLHLHPNEPLIMARFNKFIDWAAVNAESVYILGDFFHVWCGDDANDSWSQSIAERLRWLSEQQVSLYFMHGNRDFLLGLHFAKSARMTILPDPTVIQLGSQRILLAHGDRYCIKDNGHQWFRLLTRNRWFARFFLRVPIRWRSKIVTRVRQRSQFNRSKTMEKMDVLLAPIIAHLQAEGVNILIHGHTHKVGLSNYDYNGSMYYRYVLSDWDENPQLLCYYKSNRFEFYRLNFVED